MNTESSAPARPPSTLNWVAIFASYCAGGTLEDIAKTWDISLDVVKARAVRDNWKGIRLSMPLVANPDNHLNAVDEFGRNAGDLLPVEVKKNSDLILQNRQKNYEVAAALRDDLLEVIEELRNGNLKLEQAWHNKGDVTTHERDPSIVDRVNLATYAQTIANVSYRALGDMSSGDKASDVPANGGLPNAPAITIILPGAIDRPRSEREMKSAGSQTIDLRDLGEQQKKP